MIVLCFQFDGVSLSASVNRELRRRVRSIGPTSGLASHRYIVQNDIRYFTLFV